MLPILLALAANLSFALLDTLVPYLQNIEHIPVPKLLTIPMVYLFMFKTCWLL